MTDYLHYVSGFFVHREEADIVFDKLVRLGLPPAQLGIFDNETAQWEPPKAANSNVTLENVIVDGAVGAAVGTGLGLLAEVALVAANVTLFVASPLLAPLVMLGWGASLGGLIGAVVGSESDAKKEGKFADLIKDAIMNGQVVLVVQTRSAQETAIAREAIKISVGEAKVSRTLHLPS